MNGGPSSEDGEEDWGQYASPPCFMHELDRFYQLDASHPKAKDPQQDRDVARWRKGERERLILARLGLHTEQRAEQDRRIACHLDAILTAAPPVIGAYWPVSGEPDLRPWMAAAYARGARIALPAVTGVSNPMVFCEWRPDMPLKCGFGGRPSPAETAEVTPTVVIAPVVGFDRSGYRLGYGDGFLYRTLAALRPKPLLIGAGYSNALIPTIYPQPYDIPMDWIVTGVERFKPVRGL